MGELKSDRLVLPYDVRDTTGTAEKFRVLLESVHPPLPPCRVDELSLSDDPALDSRPRDTVFWRKRKQGLGST